MSALEGQIGALLDDPTNEDLAAAVREAARAEGAFAACAKAFGDRAVRLAEMGEKQAAIEAHVEAALIYEEELEQLEPAVKRYEHVLALEHDHRRALFALGTLLHDLQRWDDLIALYRRRLEETADDGERTTLHLYIAELLSERLDDAHAAFEEVKTASRLAPQNIRIIGRLQQLGERTKRVEEVAVVIGDLIINQDDPRLRAALSLRLAELHLGPLADDKRALAYLKAALMDDGGNPEILQGVEDVFRERQRFDELAEVLEETAKDRREGPHRVRLERELARIYELELDDHARALQALNRALKINAEDRELLDEVMRIGLIGGALGTVAEIYEWVTASTENTLLKTYLRLKLGHIYANVLGQHEDATRVYWAILDDEPTHAEARRRLMKLHERRDELEQVAQLLEMEVADIGTSPDALDQLTRLAELYHRRLASPDLAERTYRRILEIDPSHTVAKEALAAVAAATSQEPRVAIDDLRLDQVVGSSAVETLADEMPTEFEGDGYHPEEETQFAPPSPSVMKVTPPPAPPPPAPPPPVTAAPPPPSSPPPPPPPPDDVALSETPPQKRRKPPPPPPPDRGDSEVAMNGISAFAGPPPPREVIDEDTREVSDAVIEVHQIEEIADDAVASVQEPPPPPEEPPLDDRLGRLQRDLQAATEADDRSRIIELLEEVVQLTEELGQSERAFFSMVRLAQLEPTLAHLEEVIRLGRSAQGYPLLIDTVQKVADELDPEVAVELGLRLAEVELEDLSDPAAAIARLEDLKDRMPEDRRVFDRLVEILGAADRHEERVELLEAEAKRKDDPAEAWPLVRRAAALAERELNDPQRAVAIIGEHAARGPENAEVREEGAAILERSGAWDELIAFLTEGVTRLEGEQRATMRLRIASIYEEHLDDPDGAERMLRIGLEERARDERLLEALERINEATGRWEDVVDARIRRLDVVESAKARAELRREIAQIAEQSLGRVELALDMLTSALAEDPQNLELMDEIERLRRDRGDWDGVVEILERRAQALSDRKEQAKTWVAIARIRADYHHDLEAASTALGSALAVVPRHKAALELLAGVAERRGDLDRAIETLKRLAEEEPADERARLLVRIGGMSSARGQEDEAVSLYEQAHELDPTCLDAVLALLPLAENAEDWVRAEDLAARGADLIEDERDQADLWRRAGQIALVHLGDELKALEHFLRVLSVDPEDLATEARVGELLLERQEYQDARQHLTAAAEGLSDPARVAELYRAAGFAAEKLGDRAGALDAYGSALEHAPTMREALERSSLLAEKAGDHDRAYDLSATLVLHHEAAMASIERAPVYLRMAKAKQALGDLQAAARLARKAHQLAEELVEPLQILSEVLVELNDAFDAAEALKKIATHLRNPSEKRDALVKAARLLADEAGDMARASAMLSEAQTLAERDVEVAKLLARYREDLGDAAGAAAALCTPARLLEGRERADLLVSAARVLAGPGRDRLSSRQLLLEAVDAVPTHAGALSDLEVMLEFDGDLIELAGISEQAAQVFLEDESSAVDATDGDRKRAAVNLLERALDLYRYRLEAPERALIVSRRLMEVAPDEARHREDYARLLDAVAAQNPGSAPKVLDESINAWSELVERDPGWVEALMRLMDLRAVRGQEELARITQEILQALGHSAEIRAPANGDAAKRPSLDTQVMNAVRAVKIPPHPEEESPLAAMFTGLGFAPLKAFADAVPEPHPKKRDLVGAAGLGINVSRPLQYAAGLLGIELPPVYLRDDAMQVIEPRFVGDQPALVVSLALADKRPEEELRFLVGRCLSLLRPRALALAILPLDVLRDGLVGLAKVSDPAAFHSDPKQAKRRGRALERAIPPNSRTRLIDLAGGWLTNPGAAPGLAAERAAVLRTADRAGLVASRSVTASIGALKTLSEGRIERSWHLPLIRFATTRAFADIVAARAE